MKSRAQSILEYVIIMSVVAAAVVAMQTYFRRAVQARLEEIKQEYVAEVAGTTTTTTPTTTTTTTPTTTTTTTTPTTNTTTTPTGTNCHTEVRCEVRGRGGPPTCRSVQVCL